MSTFRPQYRVPSSGRVPIWRWYSVLRPKSSPVHSVHKLSIPEDYLVASVFIAISSELAFTKLKAFDTNRLMVLTSGVTKSRSSSHNYVSNYGRSSARREDINM